MKLDRYERMFLIVAVAVLLGFQAAIGISVALTRVRLPAPVERVDARTLRQTPPFNQPGLRQTGPNTYEAVIIAQAWQFNPNEITVPVGSTVTFLVSSPDVTHGFELTGTDVNAMVVPGEVTKVTAHFTKSGDYVFLCNEYCGFGHQTMYGKVVVR